MEIPQTILDPRPIRPKDRCVWQLARENMACSVMSSALRLATEFIFNAESDRVKHILLDFNVANSEVDLIDEEFKKRMMLICDDPSLMSKIDEKAFLKENISTFDPNIKLDLIFIHPDFITFCRDLTPESDGFHRVVFFLAIVSKNFD